MVVHKAWVANVASALALASGVLVSGEAFASTDGEEHGDGDGHDESREPGAITLGAAVEPVLALAQICSRDFDLVACGTGRGFVALELLQQFRLAHEVSLGPYLAAGLEAGDRGMVESNNTGGEESTSVRSQFGSFGADLRYWPGRSRSFWMGGRLGLLGLRDEHVVHTTAGFVKSADSFWAPSLGAGLGYDIGLGDSVALSLTLRGDYVMFRPGDGLPPDGGTQWHPGLWIALGVGIAFDV